jgi:hypothetical protein
MLMLLTNFLLFHRNGFNQDCKLIIFIRICNLHLYALCSPFVKILGARIFLYLICHDFRKIIGRIKIFDECTSDAVAHGVRLLSPHPTALGVPTAAGHGGRGAANGRQY